MALVVRRVGTSGNSLAIRVPRVLARRCGIIVGSDVVIGIEENVLTIRKIDEAMLERAASDGVNRKYDPRRKA